MNTRILSELSLLKTALSREYADYLVRVIDSCWPKDRQLIMNVYSAFCYVVMPEKNYTALDIFNDSQELNKHFQLLIGFIYSFDNLTVGRKYTLSSKFRTVFCLIQKDKQLNLDGAELSLSKSSGDALDCLAQYQKLDIDKTKLNYLDGWQVISKEGKSVEVHLDVLYVSFGADFTFKVYNAFKNYALKQKSSSLKSASALLKMLFGGMATVYTGKEYLNIETLLNSRYVQPFFHNVFKVLFVRSQALQQCPKTFHTRWGNVVRIYTECFIDTSVFGSPIKPFIVPNWKEPKDKAPTFSIGGNTTSLEKKRWFTDIPLKIRDEEAVSIIQQRIDRDMAHIKRVCRTKFDEFLKRETRNNIFIETARVKPLSCNSHNSDYYHMVGVDNLGNTVATFFTHGIGAKPNYLSFLGFYGKAKLFNTELNLPSTATLNVLLTILVMEHPLITPSWLEKWELFDIHGNQVGYKQTGNQYIAVSYKSRRGATNAQQEVVLNELSKSVVEFLIRHTSMAREFLKKNKDVNWRKMILTANHSGVTCLVNLNGNLLVLNEFHYWIQDKSLFDKNGDITSEDAKAISDIHSLRSIRRHRGFQIYLETRSMDSVAEALGHEKISISILASYLPKPLMDFFNDRWVRQFQNAILFEAMKDSEYRLEAVNMSAEDIAEFLNNHGVNFVADDSKYGFTYQNQDNLKGSESSRVTQLTYTISTALLQVLMAIRFIVDSNDDEKCFLDIVYHWYQSAVFVLDTLNSGKYSADTTLMDMLESANKNKLDTSLLEGALSC